jgi:hypothetical protein
VEETARDRDLGELEGDCAGAPHVRAPILISRVCRLVSDQDATSLGRSAACKNMPRL